MTIKAQAILVIIVGLWFFADATNRENKRLTSQIETYGDNLEKIEASLKNVEASFNKYATLSEKQAIQTQQALDKANSLNKRYQEILDNDQSAKSWSEQPLPISINGLLQ